MEQPIKLKDFFMRHRHRTLVTALAFALTCASGAAIASQQGALEFTLNDDAVSFELERPVSPRSNLHASAGLIHTVDFANTESSGQFGYATLQSIETDNQTYRAGLGMRLMGYQHDGRIAKQTLGVAFGGQFYHILPGMERVSAGAYVWVSPDVSSFGKAEQLVDSGARVNYRLLNNGDVFLGVRHGSFKHQDASERIEAFQDLHAGIRLTF